MDSLVSEILSNIPTLEVPLIIQYYKKTKQVEKCKEIVDVLAYINKTTPDKIREEMKQIKTNRNTPENRHKSKLYSSRNDVQFHMKVNYNTDQQFHCNELDLTLSAAGDLSLKMNLPRDYYLDQFHVALQTTKIPVHLLYVYGKSKEITESMAAFHWINEYSKEKFADTKHFLHFQSDTLILCVGDGVRPKTGIILAAYYPLASVYSIDPLMRQTRDDGYPNLTCSTQTIDEWMKKNTRMWRDKPWTTIIIAAIHSHAPLNGYATTLRQHHMKSHFYVIAMPCCVKQVIDSPKPLCLVASTPFPDYNVHSPKRFIHQFKDSACP